MFFVGKKDGKKRMVQDYRYLNEWMIKNNYPLPLCYELKLKELSNETTLVLSDTRELDRVPNTK